LSAWNPPEWAFLKEEIIGTIEGQHFATSVPEIHKFDFWSFFIFENYQHNFLEISILLQWQAKFYIWQHTVGSCHRAYAIHGSACAQKEPCQFTIWNMYIVWFSHFLNKSHSYTHLLKKNSTSKTHTSTFCSFKFWKHI
jgi:hypothetical protein